MVEEARIQNRTETDLREGKWVVQFNDVVDLRYYSIGDRWMKHDCGALIEW